MKRYCLTAMLFLFSIDYSHADLTGDNFNNLTNSFCGAPPTIELQNLCDELASDSGSAGPDGTGGDNNLGVVGVQSESAKNVAISQRDSIDSRLQKQKNKVIEFGLFATLKKGEIDRKATFIENGFDAKNQSLFLGVDHLYSNWLVLGVALNYIENNVIFNNGAGNTNSSGISATVFAAYTLAENVSVSGYYGRGKINYDNRRNIVNTGNTKQASSSTNAEQTVFGINISADWPRGEWRYGTSLKIDSVQTEIAAYSESSSKIATNYLFSYPIQETESLTIGVGVNASYNLSQSWGVLIPGVQLFYVHETENEARNITTGLAVAPGYSFITTTDVPDKDFFVNSITLSSLLEGDLQLFSEFSFITGNSYLNAWWLSLGLRKNF